MDGAVGIILYESDGASGWVGDLCELRRGDAVTAAVCLASRGSTGSGHNPLRQLRTFGGAWVGVTGTDVVHANHHVDRIGAVSGSIRGGVCRRVSVREVAAGGVSSADHGGGGDPVRCGIEGRVSSCAAASLFRYSCPPKLQFPQWARVVCLLHFWCAGSDHDRAHQTSVAARRDLGSCRRYGFSDWAIADLSRGALSQ